MVVRFQVSFDAADPQRLAAFWEQALGYQQQPPPDGHATWEDWARAVGIPEETWNDITALVDPKGVMPRLFFQRVPEPKTAKNHVHLDVSVSGGPEVPRQDRRRGSTPPSSASSTSAPPWSAPTTSPTSTGSSCRTPKATNSASSDHGPPAGFL
jgi:Glyoxalase-like domain